MRYANVRYVKNLFRNIRNRKIREKLTYILRNLQTLTANNSRVLRIKKAKFSGYCFYMNANIQRDSEICINVMSVCYYNATYAFQSEFTLYNCLNVKKILARNRRDIWSLSDKNRIQTHNHLARKRTLNHLVSFAKWLSVRLRAKWLWVWILLLSLH